MKCKYCGTNNADGISYCTACGKSIAQSSGQMQTETKLCPNCGKPSPKESLFCGHCGSRFYSDPKHDDKSERPLYILNYVDKYIGDIMLGISSSGGNLMVYGDRVEYEITRANMSGTVLGRVGGDMNNGSVSEGIIETYKYTDIQGCYVSNFSNSRPGILFILNNGVRFKFVCPLGSAEPTDVIRAINTYIAQAQQMVQSSFMQQYQMYYPQPGQDVQPQPYPQPIAYPQPPTPVQPGQDIQPQPYPQPIAYPQPPTPVQPGQDIQPQPYPQPIAYPQPPTPVQPGQDIQPQPYPQPLAPDHGYAYPQGASSGMKMPEVKNIYSADNYAKYTFAMEITNFIRVDEQYIAVVGSVKKGTVTKGEVLNVVSRNGLEKGSFEVRSIAVNKAISESAAEGNEDAALLCSFSPSMLKAGDIVCA